MKMPEARGFESSLNQMARHLARQSTARPRTSLFPLVCQFRHSCGEYFSRVFLNPLPLSSLISCGVTGHWRYCSARLHPGGAWKVILTTAVRDEGGEWVDARWDGEAAAGCVPQAAAVCLSHLLGWDLRAVTMTSLCVQAAWYRHTGFATSLVAALRSGDSLPWLVYADWCADHLPVYERHARAVGDRLKGQA